ncbi:MAG: hypothetical protein NC311_04245 [Muribaculaceae bacterium]|nr:hypothetical protein [Muribaculaceae bacterium]
MKTKQLIIVASCVTITLIQNTNATSIGVISPVDPIQPTTKCTLVDCPSNVDTLPILGHRPTVEVCTPGTAVCYSDGSTTYKYQSCASCNSPYSWSSYTIDTCPNIMFSTCACNCSDCLNGDFIDISTGYQRKALFTCDCSSDTAACVNAGYEYRCATGYYGSSTNGTSGCTPCPTWDGVYTTSTKTTSVRGTSTAGTTAITGCYIPSGTYYDTTGTFTIGSNCKYQN